MIINEVGNKYCMLTVVNKVKSHGKNSRWNCRCECGNETEVFRNNLISGNVKSCGCSKYKYGHGLRKHKLYDVWNTMKARCENVNNNRYDRYGKRGIKVCDEWKNPEVFIKWALGSGWEPRLQIDRIDNDGNYCPSNCRFVDSMTNAHNKSPLMKNNKSGYAGVFLYKKNNKFQSVVTSKTGSKFLGYYMTPEDAAVARDRYIIENNLPHKLQILGE